MQAYGTIRKIDELGRIVIPKDLRKKFEIGVNSAIEIFIEQDGIVLQKFTPLKDISQLKHIADSLSRSLDCDCYVSNQISIIPSDHNKNPLTDEIKYDLVQAKKMEEPHQIVMPIEMDDMLIGSFLLQTDRTFTHDDALSAKSISFFLSKQVSI